MTDTSTAGTRDSGHDREHDERPARRQRSREGNPVGRMFSALSLFISQILDELRKVVRPTRHELLTYTTVVIVFVTLVMLFVFGLDNLFTRVVLWVFGG